MKSGFQPALMLATALALVNVFAPPCAGRQSNAGQRGVRPDSTQRELQRTLERDLMFKELQEMAARGPAAQPSRGRASTQINEDFARIQMVNNALAQALAAGDELDFRLVAQAASEIGKRAGRLKNGLALPEAERGEHRRGTEIGAEPSQLKAALRALDALIISFVSNPGFRSVKVLDTQWPAKARRDLEEIIELSGRIKRGSERFYKTTRKSH